MLLLGISIALTSCEKEPEPIPVSGITMDSTSLTMIEGETAKLKATISPSNADNQGVIWSSSNASVASVSNGTVTAVSAGSAIITAKSDDGGKTATCNVTVNSKIVAVTGVSLDNTSLELEEGEEYSLKATVQPANASNKQVSWKSGDETIATVSDGKVKAIKPGSTTITVSTSDGNKTASCSIKVNEKIYHVESVSLDKTSLELTEGDEATLTATVLPENANNKNILWSSSNENVATVSNGLVKAVAPGTTSIIAKSEDGGKSAQCNVIVKEKIYPVESVTLDMTSMVLTEGDEARLLATVQPENATNKKLIWTSSDDTIVSVSEGVIKALMPGTATVTVETEDGGKTANCQITVNAKYYPVENIILDKSSIVMIPGQSYSLSATIKPDNATDKSIKWSSSDNNIASVIDGIITAISKGQATITAQCGEIKTTCQITVINEDELDLENKVTVQLTGSGLIISTRTYYSRTYTIKNNSIVDIELVSIATSNSLDISGTVKAGESHSETIYLSYNVYPEVTVTFKFNGKEYKVKTDSGSSTSSKASTGNKTTNNVSTDFITATVK